MKSFAVLGAAVLAFGQEAMRPGSIEGVVRAEGNGPFLADEHISTGRFETRTDAAGRYTLRGLPPGSYPIMVGARARGSAAYGTRTVTVGPGQAVIADFSLPLKGTISGKVFDSNDEPVPGVEVVLIAREYGSGALRHFRRTVARTNDEGAYRMESVRPGIPYLLLFRKMDHRKMNPVSDAPTEPKLRRPATVPTYYPGAAETDGATAITLRGGEQREDVNVRLLRAGSYCMEGVLTVAGRPAPMTFEIHEAHLSFGLGPQGGTTGIPPGGESGPDGRIRICDLHPGDYRLTAFTGDLNKPESMSTIPVSIRDRDVRDVTVQPTPRLQIPVEFLWAAEPPEKPVDAKPSVSLISINRSFGGFAGSRAETLPGKSEIGGLLMDDYYLRVSGLTGRLYVKEILYGTENVTHSPFRAGSVSAGSVLRVVAGHDGGLVKVRVSDREGHPIPDATLIVAPASSGSDGELAAVLMTGQSDQYGDYSSRAMKPGKYLVFATMSPLGDLNHELIAKVRAGRSQSKEISVEPTATVEVKVQPVLLP